MAFDLFKSGLSNERQAFAQGTNPLVRARLMQLLAQANPNDTGAAPTFESALGQGKFDTSNLSALLAMMLRQHEPSGGGPDVSSGMMAMR